MNTRTFIGSLITIPYAAKATVLNRFKPYILRKSIIDEHFFGLDGKKYQYDVYYKIKTKTGEGRIYDMNIHIPGPHTCFNTKLPIDCGLPTQINIMGSYESDDVDGIGFFCRTI